MKKNEIAIIILMFSLTAVAVYFTFGALLPTPGKEEVQVETAEKIEPTVAVPSKDIFNTEAINPTVKVKIGSQSNQQPFTIGQ